MSAIKTLAKHLENGPVRTARVSSAQAHGNAKKYAYWGVARYQLRLSRDGAPINTPLEQAGSDRRSERLAEQDLDELCEREGRLPVQRIGRLTEQDATIVCGYLGLEIAAEELAAV